MMENSADQRVGPLTMRRVPCEPVEARLRVHRRTLAGMLRTIAMRAPPEIKRDLEGVCDWLAESYREVLIDLFGRWKEKQNPSPGRAAEPIPAPRELRE